MTDDPGSLANLRDIVLPDPVSYWPPAPGVWIVAVGLIAALAALAWRALERRRANAYRRAAAAKLRRMAVQSAPPSVDEISEVLKRAALIAYGRDRTASLTGPAWSDFLIESGGNRLSPSIVQARFANAYSRASADGGSEALDQAGIWLRTHRQDRRGP